MVQRLLENRSYIPFLEEKTAVNIDNEKHENERNENVYT